MEWLVDTWNTYKDTILPILMTIASVGGSFLIYYIPKIFGKWLLNLGVSEKKIDAIGAFVEKTISREEFAPLVTTVKSLTQKLAATEEQNKLLAEMIRVAFDGTSLDPQYKEQLSSIYSKVLYKTEDALVDALEDQLKKANDKILALEQKLVEPKIIEESPAPSRVSRPRT